ncbi:ABC transporter [Shewanella putrefaciens]|nr:ABC transporter [Shewanella putrefaciens]
MTRTLTLHQVHSDYQGQQVLKGLSLDLAQGEILALLGPSGCGKTTLLRAVAGLQAISQGEILINGKLVSGQKTFVPSEQRGIGMIFQDYALFPHLTVAENILFGVPKLSGAQRQSRLDDMLSLVKLDGLAKRYPHELSVVSSSEFRLLVRWPMSRSYCCLMNPFPISTLKCATR